MIRSIPPLDEATLATEKTPKEAAGFGMLETARGNLPLAAMDVRAKIVGLCCHATVTQTYCNSLDEALEATYIFPLPDRAAVTEFRMRVADRIVEGQLKERGQARSDYQQAIREGHRAAIAEEDRSGTFTMRVGNIPAGEEVTVELQLVSPLPVSAGEATFQFPLVVAPRYIPGIPLSGPSVGGGTAADTDQVPDASRVTPPVLLPGFPNPVRLSLEVEIDPAGLSMAAGPDAPEFRSSLHSVLVEQGPPWIVRLQPGERLNRDFILRFPVTSETTQAALVCSAAGDEPGTMALTLVPPASAVDLQPVPRDVVVVLDRSGSMQGWKMVAARRAVGRMIDTLRDQDRFTLLAFDSVNEFPRHADGMLVAATNRARWRAVEWLGKIDARGGTEMGPALEAAARLLAHDDPARQPVLVLVTDGQVGGEDAVLKALQSAAGGVIPRIHTLGIDRSVNAGFLRRLADLGDGTCDLVESEQRLDEAMEHIHHTIATPVLKRLRLEPLAGQWLPESLAPGRLPDLFADRPITLFARHLSDPQTLQLRVHATDIEGNAWQQDVTAQPGPEATLLSLWGRARVRDLEDRYASGQLEDPSAAAAEIVQVSLSCGVLSRFTAYVAVDRSEVVNQGGNPREIVQPVDAPDGWDMFAEGEATGSMNRCLSMALPVEAYECRSARSILKRMVQPISRSDHADRAPVDAEPLWQQISELLDKLEGRKRQRRSARRRTLDELCRLLRSLERMLDMYLQLGQGNASNIQVAEVVRQSFERLREDEMADDPAARDAARLSQLVADARKMLTDLRTHISPERDRFWT